MSLPRLGFIGLAVVAALATWLLLAGPARVFGIEAGNAGMVLLMAVGWGSLHAISRIPDGGIGESMSPGEWRAWLGLAFTLVIAAYAIVHAPVFHGPPLWHNPDANRIGRNIVMLLVAWMLLARVLDARWRRGVRQDERDREIEARGAGAARLALVVILVGYALLLSFSPTERLEWAVPPLLGHLLVLALIVSCAFEYLVVGLGYWRDRR
ncbi:hypothetical protein [Dokdonella fugitiva]|jgi:hypothetical protein|uniref:Uncharacterized protein n=1 Tax=Dokdonella fugitiva TaxID=328517 RepID=A0A4R2I417_9GAMM|nr:hypothetical protein [Dokdonella fugitiva]TCO38299.1 hypothetical protein EV148_108137 [Dokdonella fugitiva]